MNPAVYNLNRQAETDDIIPLSKPITTTSGEVINELAIPKGIKVILSIAGYNRCALFLHIMEPFSLSWFATIFKYRGGLRGRPTYFQS